ncbi:MAG: helix-turn-helix transcriptional regulator [Rhodospirillales bacterium]|nr:helix-turn-helix transcriptional regulator [Rhodospirillales bacterium]
MRKQRHEMYLQCLIEATLDMIGGKWKGAILMQLLEGTKRFGELRRLLPKATQRTLTQQLRGMERDGLVDRRVFAQVPPKVEYSLTDRGRSLRPVLVDLKNWGEAHVLGTRQKKNPPAAIVGSAVRARTPA